MKQHAKTKKVKKNTAKTASKPLRTSGSHIAGKEAVVSAVAAKPLQKVSRRWRPLRRKDRPVRPEVIARLPGSFRLLARSVAVLKSHWRIFTGITLIYLLCSTAFVQGFGSIDLNGLKEAVGSVGSDHGRLASSVVLLSALVTSAGSGSDGANAYQSMLLLITSLATIWALRHVMAGEEIRIRDAYYQGMYPLVPVVLVVLFMGLQLLPLLIGAALYGIVTVNGIAASLVEQLVWIGLFFALAVWSLYLITSSVVAVYVAALPNMAPVAALRNAKELVRFRRWAVLRRLLVLPIVLFVITIVIMLPVILFVTSLAPLFFYTLTALWIPLTHSYAYTLYRELLP